MMPWDGCGAIFEMVGTAFDARVSLIAVPHGEGGRSMESFSLASQSNSSEPRVLHPTKGDLLTQSALVVPGMKRTHHW